MPIYPDWNLPPLFFDTTYSLFPPPSVSLLLFQSLFSFFFSLRSFYLYYASFSRVDPNLFSFSQSKSLYRFTFDFIKKIVYKRRRTKDTSPKSPRIDILFKENFKRRMCMSKMSELVAIFLPVSLL